MNINEIRELTEKARAEEALKAREAARKKQEAAAETERYVQEQSDRDVASALVTAQVTIQNAAVAGKGSCEVKLYEGNCGKNDSLQEAPEIAQRISMSR